MKNIWVENDMVLADAIHGLGRNVSFVVDDVTLPHER